MNVLNDLFLLCKKLEKDFLIEIQFKTFLMFQLFFNNKNKNTKQVNEESAKDEIGFYCPVNKNILNILFIRFANSTMDVECQQHSNMDEASIAEENCLKLFLDKTIILVQFNYIIAVSIQETMSCKTLHKTEAEGETFGLIKCDFQRKLKDLNAHLINECPLNLINCCFKQFGCDHTCFNHNLNKHLITNMKLHFHQDVIYSSSNDKIIRFWYFKHNKQLQ
ncbi:hypothetical protein RFI_26742 [Reticulomyxa filosa]|uniref:TRAF-type domain-containing protein n=1 Tax=Reticulomyxa filosa TaxID=46433 RepID=X6MC62_RETFI|nr:hypothetical protein RFI_26742 [Reticulomyxa filosa]|eukprot:ETO10635.1 hypothetical protein RFI_26742 [Reticulomyxa filosa]